MKYLLDTCAISDFFKKIPATLDRLKRVKSNQLLVSSITVAEIEYGLELNPERAAKIKPLWNALMKEITLIPFAYDEAKSAALVRAKLKSNTIGAYDCLIAGTAIAHNLILVTSNMREFSRLNDLLEIENWRM